MYPNPLKNRNVYLKYDEDIDVEGIWLYDMAGNFIKYFKGKSEQINLISYESGIYILKVLTNEGTIVRKIVKKNK